MPAPRQGPTPGPAQAPNEVLHKVLREALHKVPLLAIKQASEGEVSVRIHDLRGAGMATLMLVAIVVDEGDSLNHVYRLEQNGVSLRMETLQQ
jgi:hypothetical protein